MRLRPVGIVSGTDTGQIRFLISYFNHLDLESLVDDFIAPDANQGLPCGQEVTRAAFGDQVGETALPGGWGAFSFPHPDTHGGRRRLWQSVTPQGGVSAAWISRVDEPPGSAAALIHRRYPIGMSRRITRTRGHHCPANTAAAAPSTRATAVQVATMVFFPLVEISWLFVDAALSEPGRR
jgi:hypothetical protein